MEIIVKEFKDLTPYELHSILKMRIDVFVVEQNCIYSDVDDFDLDAVHILIKDNGRCVATSRILGMNKKFEEISIGRVITIDRGKGYGRILMEESVKAAIKYYKAKKIVLGAQVQAKGFYKKCGFKEYGDVFDEDGIPHIHMMMEV